ncbi:signal peptidase I [Candidatus Woesearchaeota archaeon]|nr:signal peptidase I [Candidatus Woesearchaeota archaeon]
MRNEKLLIIVCAFILGVLVTVFVQGSESRYAFSEDAVPTESPSDHINDEDLFVFKDRALIEKDNLIWARVKDTHSMEPVLNADSVSLELKPQDTSFINKGDIISFRQGSKVIIHRVVLTGQDKLGWFCVTKGDNNKEPDPYKVRFDDVKGVVVGILY